MARMLYSNGIVTIVELQKCKIHITDLENKVDTMKDLYSFA